jgi:2-iminobutanoate/2-iminopropanoate deaminase
VRVCWRWSFSYSRACLPESNHHQGELIMKIYEELASLAPAMKSAGIAQAGAIESNGLVFFSGLTAFDIRTGALSSGPFAADAMQTMEVVRAVLGDIGLSLDNVIKVNAYLRDPGAFLAWNEIYKKSFKVPRPCRTTVGAPLVVGLIELDIIASRDSRI